MEQSKFGDLYHLLLTVSWSRLIGMLVLGYLAVNSVFAILYMLDPGGLENAQRGRFLDHFFFSVQTMATIGYGKMTPLTVYTNALVTIEALVGMLSMAMATGLMFSKFSRPTARVMFSNRLLITQRDGGPALVLRMANQRANQIVEATLRLVLLRDDVTPEGERVRRISDLKLYRPQSAVFALSWTAYHPITPDSPLHGVTEEQMRSSSLNILASIIGTDETFSQTVHARHTWFADEVVFGGRFADILQSGPGGKIILDYEHFHTVLPAKS
jgi:inward rectifier potassium channel